MKDAYLVMLLPVCLELPPHTSLTYKAAAIQSPQAYYNVPNMPKDSGVDWDLPIASTHCYNIYAH
jgi:hypothetical protein